MSAKVQGQVWELDLPHNKQLLMLALADHSNDEGGSVYPGVDRLAWKTGYGRRQVQRLLRELEKDGLISVAGRTRGGRGNTTQYQIHLENGVKKSPFQPPKRVTFNDALSVERVTSGAQKGDTAVSPEPSVEPSVSSVPSVPAAPTNDEPSEQPADATTLHSHRSEAAGIVRRVYWQADEPPPAISRKYPDWSMARELDIWNGFVDQHDGEFTPAEINAGLEVVRDVEDWGPDPPLSLLLFNVEGRRDRLRLCVQHAQQRQPENGEVAEHIGDILREAIGNGDSGKPVEPGGGSKRARRHADRPGGARSRSRSPPR